MASCPWNKIRAFNRGLLARGQYERLGALPRSFYFFHSYWYDWNRNPDDRTKNKHHNGTQRKLTYRRFSKLKKKSL
ncbi:MAG: hypothetical protein ACFFBD_11885 [Candidatus Hodarchaeota archaeon]